MTEGDSYDDAAAETANASSKTEVIRRRGRENGLDDVELATSESSGRDDRWRLHSWCGDRPPAEWSKSTTVRPPA